MKHGIAWLCCAAALCGSMGPAAARTIELGAESLASGAVISPEAPRLSWVADGQAHVFFSTSQITLWPGRTVLLRFDLSAIPKGMKITSAQWVIPIVGHLPAESRFYVWRTVADWGLGVCQIYRRTVPEHVEWTEPGGRGSGSDRALRPTVITVTSDEDQSVSVTKDVQLWYSGQVANNGWMITVEDQGTWFRLRSPVSGANFWRLRVTYEPQ